MTYQKWMRFAAITVCLAGGVAALYLIGNVAVELFLPFVLAFLIASLARAAAGRLSARLRIGEKPLTVVLVLLLLLAVGFFLYWFCSRLLLELQNLLTRLLEDSGNPEGQLARVLSFFRRLVEGLPFEGLQNGGFLESIIGEPEAFFAEQLQGFLSKLSEQIPAGVVALLRALPRILLFLLITVIACFYFALDYDQVTSTASSLFPARLRERLPHWRHRIGEAMGRYLRAYFLLFLLTFGELWVGLLILQVEYAFLLALLIALLDILPVLGVGTALVPWALLSLLSGNLYHGIGLLLLYGVITVVRQIIEPHLVGKSLGLHPILMLIAFYAGLRAFGVAGIFIGPAIMLLLKSFWQSRAQQAH